MSRRIGGGRGKAKKDDLAKAAAEVLNNIATAPTPAVAQPTLSAGLLRGAAADEADTGADVQPRQLQPPHDPEQLLQVSITPHPASVFFSSKRETAATAPQPASLGEEVVGGPGGGEAAHCDRDGAAAAVAGEDNCDVGVGPGHISEPVGAPPNIRPLVALASPAKPPQQPRSAAAVAAASAVASTAVLRFRGYLQNLLPRRLRHNAFAAADTDGLGLDADVHATGRADACAAITAKAALLLLLVSFVGLSIGGYSLGRAASRAQGPLQQAVDELTQGLGKLRQQLGELRKLTVEAAAAAATEVREELRGMHLRNERLSVRVAELKAGLENVSTAVQGLTDETRTQRQALEARDAVQSIQDHGGGGEGEGAVGMVVTDVTATVTAPGGADDAAAVELSGGSGGSDLRGLPACDARRMAAAAGPLVPARVTRHSPVVGDDEPLMRVHSALSYFFAPDRVHPLARQLTSPGATPLCLPLASLQAAAGGHGGSSGDPGGDDSPFLELTLLARANVSAVSFRYPAYGTWDTSSALLHLVATLHEAPTGAAESAAGGGAAPPLSDIRGLHSRQIELPPLRGMECQHVAIPPAQLGDYGARMVYGITLHVYDNFGNPEYSCMPRVLVHGQQGGAA